MQGEWLFLLEMLLVFEIVFAWGLRELHLLKRDSKRNRARSTQRKSEQDES